MDKINRFTIKSLEVSGFKCFAEPIAFEFGKVNFITGSNHVGKSTIADAISFTITGTPFYGDGHIDRMYSEHNPDIGIRMVFESETGVHELVRKRRKDKMYVSYDGYAVRQQDLNEMFGEKDLFLSIINPLYFIERLGDDGKALLEKHLPFVPHEKIIAKLSPYNQELLKDKDILAPENYMKSVRENIREQEETIIFLEGQSSLLLTQRKDTANAINLLQISLNDISAQIADLESQKGEGSQGGALKEKLDSMLTILNEHLSDRPIEPSTAELDHELEQYNSNIKVLLEKNYESKFASHLTQLSEELKDAYAKHKRITAQMAALKPGSTCPLCLNSITEVYSQKAKEALSTKIAEIVSEGTALRGQLEELKALDAKSKDVFDTFRSQSLQEYEARSSELKSKIQELKEQWKTELQEYDVKLSEYREAVQSLQEQDKLGNLTAEQAEELKQLYEKKVQIEADLAAQQVIYQNQVDTTPDKIESTRKSIKDNQTLLTAVAEYAAHRAELTFGCLTAGDVSFKLYEVAKTTGEVKDCFKFTYAGRDYKRLSRSEKILAGICVSEMIKNLAQKDYPLFIDDSESVAGIPIPSGQAFLSRVVANSALDVRVMTQAGQTRRSAA